MMRVFQMQTLRPQEPTECSKACNCLQDVQGIKRFALGDTQCLHKVQTLRLREPTECSKACNCLYDVQGHWAEAVLKLFVQLGIVEGDEDGTAKPNAAVSRAEFAAILARVYHVKAAGQRRALAMLSRLINLPLAKREGTALSFSDLTDAGGFAVQTIQDTANAGIIQGMCGGRQLQAPIGINAGSLFLFRREIKQS